MKTNQIGQPGFRLMTLTDTVSYFHMQMPRWLFFDRRYSDLSLESKIAYTFLLNRFQLSRRNGWVNEANEVYVIYTREKLAEEMQISYRKALRCFKELAEKQLLWEQRPGRGLPNRIYLAEVAPTAELPAEYDCAPFDAPSRPAEMALLDDDVLAEQTDTTQADHTAEHAAEAAEPDSQEEISASGERDAVSDLPKPQVLTCETGSTRPAETALPDLQKRHPNKKEKNKKEIRNTEKDPTVPCAGADEEPQLNDILQRCRMERYTAEESLCLSDAIAWLYYCGELRAGPCTYPQDYVRQTLQRLNADVLDDALYKLHRNETPGLRNSLAYAAKVVFCSIMELGSDMLLDPLIQSHEREEARHVFEP